jgi:hypothetical protein
MVLAAMQRIVGLAEEGHNEHQGKHLFNYGILHDVDSS